MPSLETLEFESDVDDHCETFRALFWNTPTCPRKQLAASLKRVRNLTIDCFCGNRLDAKPLTADARRVRRDRGSHLLTRSTPRCAKTDGDIGRAVQKIRRN